MCEYEKSLIAWIDGELEPDTASDLEHHLQTCESCSAEASQYREVSRAFAAYCAAAPVPKRRSRARWITAGVAGLAAAAAMILWTLPVPVQRLPLQVPKTAHAPAVAFETQPAPVKKVHRQTFAKRNQVPEPSVTSLEPFVEIAIPADAIFAPGALPPGVTFSAALGIGGDGSPRILRLQPGFK